MHGERQCPGLVIGREGHEAGFPRQDPDDPFYTRENGQHSQESLFEAYIAPGSGPVWHVLHCPLGQVVHPEVPHISMEFPCPVGPEGETPYRGSKNQDEGAQLLPDVDRQIPERGACKNPPIMEVITGGSPGSQ